MLAVHLIELSRALFDRNGVAAGALFALGPPIRGSLWETAAVPDIRKQCEALARLRA